MSALDARRTETFVALAHPRAAQATGPPALTTPGPHIHSTHVSCPHKIVLHAAASNYQNYEFQRACTIAAACQTEIDARRSLPCRERNCCGSARPLSSTYELLFEYSAPNSASADPFLALYIFPYFALGFWAAHFGLSPFPCARRAFRAVRVRRTRLPAVPS